MPSEADFLDITLRGKEYRVACPPENKDALLRAVAFVDDRMQEIAEKTRSPTTERIAVMAALNISYDFLSLQDSSPQSATLDFAAVKRRITLMEARIDAAMEPQDKLI